MGAADDETVTFINQTYQRADAFLFGPQITGVPLPRKRGALEGSSANGRSGRLLGAAPLARR